MYNKHELTVRLLDKTALNEFFSHKCIHVLFWQEKNNILNYDLPKTFIYVCKKTL